MGAAPKSGLQKQQAESGADADWKQWEGQIVGGRFPLRKYLGSSNHSTVFLTERSSADPQKAVIKLVAAEPESAAEQLSRWQAAARLSHPNLLRLFEMGRCSIGGVDCLFAVMEYADENLAEILPLRVLTAEEAWQMLGPVLDALTYLHRSGLAHGHIQPSNILVVGEHLKISSDGIVPAGQSADLNREQGRVYDAPEAAQGPATPAADIWSLGVTLVEALTQRAPARSDADPRRQTLVPSAVPAPFREIAVRALERDPKQRPAAVAISAMLRAGASEDRGRAASVPELRKMMANGSKPAKARQNVGVVVAVIAAVIVFAALIGIIGAPKIGNKAQPAMQAESPAVTAQSEPPRQSSPAKPSPAAAMSGPIAAAVPAPAPVTAMAMHATASAVLHQVIPNVPQSARNTIEGTVRVRVRAAVDASGNVTGATLESAGPSQYFARLALEAARGWKFSPESGQSAPRAWVLRFEFARTATRVIPSPVQR